MPYVVEWCHDTSTLPRYARERAITSPPLKEIRYGMAKCKKPKMYNVYMPSAPELIAVVIGEEGMTEEEVQAFYDKMQQCG